MSQLGTILLAIGMLSAFYAVVIYSTHKRTKNAIKKAKSSKTNT